MATLWLKEFTGGLDTRRMPETTAGGVLIRGRDGHISRGGEFDKRAAFVRAYALPAGTVGLAYTSTGLVVFGSDASPTLPVGVTYQRLRHPDGATALVRVPSWDLYAGKIYAVGEFADGSRYHYYDGTRVADWFDGRARARFTVTGGTDTGSTISIAVGGVAIVAEPVAWRTSNAATASAIAEAINAFVASPDYTATAVDDVVNIIAPTTGTTYNNQSVSFTLAGGFAVTPSAGLVTAGGVAGAATFTPGTFVRTLGTRMTSVSGPTAHGSGLSKPANWTTDTTGAFFIDMSTQAAGAEALTALATYQQFVAVFAERVVQIWTFASDPSANALRQVLRNVGTASPRSVTDFGDNDLFFLDESGLRSLRARDSSNAAATSDIGVPVDGLVTAKLRTLTSDQRAKIIGLIEPSDGRFWLCMLDEVFVFSYFPGSKISAWTTYTPAIFDNAARVPFSIDDACVFNRKVWLRSGNDIMVYGGTGSTLVYDATEAEAWTPYFDAGTPTVPKTLQGVDAALTGTWEVRVAMEPANLNASDKVATISGSTFPDERILAGGVSTHFSLRFKTTAAESARLGAVVVTYATAERSQNAG